MNTILKSSSLLLASAFLLLGCEQQPSNTEITDSQNNASVLNERADYFDRTRPSLTQQQCLIRDGVVIGDIGDGRIHSKDYRCADGRQPMGTIVYEKGEAINTEGAVCCGQNN